MILVALIIVAGFAYWSGKLAERFALTEKLQSTPSYADTKAVEIVSRGRIKAKRTPFYVAPTTNRKEQ